MIGDPEEGTYGTGCRDTSYPRQHVVFTVEAGDPRLADGIVGKVEKMVLIPRNTPIAGEVPRRLGPELTTVG